MIKLGKRAVSAIVLAGGGSTRMGKNKALLQLGKKTMIERIVDTLRPLFSEIILVTNHPEEYHFLKDIIYIKDEKILEERNSLIGIYSGLLAANNPYAFVVPCDMPLLNQGLIKYMIDKLGDEDVFIPLIEGHYQPLHAIYSKGCIEPIRKLLDQQKYKIINFFHEVSIRTIDEDTVKRFSKEFTCFLNVNTYQAYLDIQKHWDKLLIRGD